MVRARVSRESLVELRGKYAEMLEMRVTHLAGTEDATAVRVRMARLASRFPGALREIDDLRIEEIRRRVETLDVAVRGEGQVEPWMEAMALFHALTRGALAIKRWLAGRKRIDAALRRRLAAELPSLPFPKEAGDWAIDLARVASPPRGRVIDAVFARLAETLGVSQRDARRMVFGAPRRERSRLLRGVR